jgi:4-hydroxyphenylpyruvate dioxygenase
MTSTLPRLKWAVATVSLGRHPSHTLERKLASAAKHGFQGIELVHAELLAHARANGLTPIQSAQLVNKLCRQHGLEILSLNPLKNFEGNVNTSLQERLETAQEWIDLASAVGTRIIQMPSQFLSSSIDDASVIIPELQALADRAALSSLTIAYEAVAFAKFNYLWQHGLRIVEAVDRPNFALCLDSYHVHARIWGDPYARTGVLPRGNEHLDRSMSEFLEACPRERVLYLQLSDASKFDPPLTEDSPLFDGLEVKDARLAWSRSARPFPLESPGYFPVAEIAKTWLVDYAWEGWVSLEGFLAETEREENGPEVMAARARKSIRELSSRLGVQL